jgi:SAM-dependent methyltransferase
VAAYHERRPAITERLLDSSSPSPYAWLAEALAAAPQPVLDLACGSAPTRPLMASAMWIGVDASVAELAAAAAAGRGPLVRATADALPIADAAIGTMCAAMCLPVLTPLGVVLTELMRVLRPGGRLVAVVPSMGGMSVRETWRWARIMRTLRLRSLAWPNPEARDGLAGLLTAQGFDILADERRVFRLPITCTKQAEMLIDGLYLPGVEPARVETARRRLARWAGPGRYLALPLRRVVAEWPGSKPP